MPTLDVFNSDAFSTRELTMGVNKLPYKAGKLGELGIFQSKSVSTPLIQVEERNGKLALVMTKPRRGSQGQLSEAPTRKMHPFTVPHLPEEDAVYADDVMGIRAFGTESDVETVSGIVADKMQAMKDNLEVTTEYHRIGAIQGKILDGDGTTQLFDFFDEFEVTEDTVQFSFAAGSVKADCAEVVRTMEFALGAVPFDYVVGMCGNAFWDLLVAAADVTQAYTAYVNGGSEFLRTQQRAKGFYFGDILWMNYRGKVGDVDFINTDQCRFFPVGVPGMFQEIYAPANWVETVNTAGIPTYAKQWPMKLNVGVELHMQRNVLCMCNRPSALIKGTHS